MNILPHKSWHVWRKENLERVQEDEEAHEEQLRSKREREKRIEAESRYALLKKRAKLRKEGKPLPPVIPRRNSETEVEKQKSEDRHVNLFEEVEAAEEKGVGSVGSMEEKPKSEDKEREMKTHALGYGSSEKSGKHPWYSLRREASFITDEEKEMNSWLGKDSRDPLRLVEVCDEITSEKPKTRERRRRDREHRDSSETKKLSTMQRLRQERKERERAEREKAAKLLGRHDAR